MSEKKFIPINVDHIARVEGKGGIEIIYSEGKVEEVKLNIMEGPRFFESITVGKKVEDALSIFPRICSFCSAAHKLTAVDAVEKAVGFKPSEEIQALRELLYIGDIIESHALHLYLLALPDFLGFSGPFNAKMLNMYRNEIETGLALKRLGNYIMDELGSRSIHQENVILGGFGKLPEKRFFEKLRDKLREAAFKAEYTFFLFTRFQQYNEVSGKIVHVAVKPYNDEYGIYGDSIITSEGIEFRAEDYKQYFIEKVVPYSFSKHCYLQGVSPFMTGAISRVVLNGKKLSGKALELYNTYKHLLSSENPFANNLAQALELVYFTEKALKIVEMILERWPVEPSKPVELKDGYGVSITEAPRGVLLYAIKIENGKLSYVDIITPTAFNMAMMEHHVKMMAQAHAQDPEEKLKLFTEMVVRAYDPCISCSVHLIKRRQKKG